MSRNGNGGNHETLIMAVEASSYRSTVRAMAKGYDATGIVSPDVETVKKNIDMLRKKGEFKEAAILENVVSGGCWHEGRIFEAKLPEADGRCTRCGGAETSYHRYYGCVHNDKVSSRVTASNYLRHLALDQMQERQGLWFRGIPEKPNIGEMQEEICPDLSFDIDPTRILRSVWGTDGSGGKYSSDPNLRRAGWGAALVAEVKPEHLLKSSVPARDNDEDASTSGSFDRVL